MVLRTSSSKSYYPADYSCWASYRTLSSVRACCCGVLLLCVPLSLLYYVSTSTEETSLHVQPSVRSVPLVERSIFPEVSISNSVDSQLFDDTEIISPPLSVKKPPPSNWEVLEHFRGVVASQDDTDPSPATNNYHRPPAEDQILNSTLDHFFFVQGQNASTASLNALETLSQFLRDRNKSATTKTFDRERVVRYIFVALSVSAQETCAGKDVSKGLRLSFVQYLGIRSAFVNLKAEKVVIHANCSFTGPFMDELRRLVGDSVHVREVQDLMSPWRRLQIHRLPNLSFRTDAGVVLQPYHKADYVKVLVGYKYGGIVADFDILFEPASEQAFNVAGRFSECTLGNDVDALQHNMSYSVNLGLTFCKRGSLYMLDWLTSYHNLYRKNWVFNSGTYPTELTQTRPHTPILIDGSMALLRGEELVKPRPTKHSLELWKISTAIHHLSHVRNVFIVPLIKQQLFNKHSSILARSMRRILYGSEDVCRDVAKFPSLSKIDLL